MKPARAQLLGAPLDNGLNLRLLSRSLPRVGARKVIGRETLLWRSTAWWCCAKPAKATSRHPCQGSKPSQIMVRRIAIVIHPASAGMPCS